MTDSDADDGVTTVEKFIGYKSGLLANGAIGLDGDMYRVEAAIGYQVNDFDNVLGVEVPSECASLCRSDRKL